MRPIVYVASYPRSGNTFLRALLANYLTAADHPLTPRDIAFFGAGEKHEALWRQVTGVDRRERTIEIEWAARRDYLAAVRAQPGTEPVFLKTHTLNGTVFGAPGFFLQPNDRIVYVVRHPLDVLVSASHFFAQTAEVMAERMLASGAFNTSDGGYFEITGAWTENVGGWVTETACPVLIVKFESLASTTGAEFTRVLDFLEEPAAPERVERAVAAAGFEVLQASHAEQGFDQGPGRDPREPFFRVGRAAQWRAALPPALATRMTAELGAFMRVFDYEGTPSNF